MTNSLKLRSERFIKLVCSRQAAYAVPKYMYIRIGGGFHSGEFLKLLVGFCFWGKVVNLMGFCFWEIHETPGDFFWRDFMKNETSGVVLRRTFRGEGWQQTNCYCCLVLVPRPSLRSIEEYCVTAIMLNALS